MNQYSYIRFMIFKSKSHAQRLGQGKLYSIRKAVRDGGFQNIITYRINRLRKPIKKNVYILKMSTSLRSPSTSSGESGIISIPLEQTDMKNAE